MWIWSLRALNALTQHRPRFHQQQYPASWMQGKYGFMISEFADYAMFGDKWQATINALDAVELV